MLDVFPCLSVDNALNRAYCQSIVLGYLGLCVATFRASSNRADIPCCQLGRANGFPTRQPMRKATGWVCIAGQQSALRRGVSNVLSLGAKPEMRRITAGRIVADVQDADAIRPKPRFISQCGIRRKLVGDAMYKTHFPGPLHLAVAIAARAYKWPALIWRANGDTTPEPLRIDTHNATVAWVV